ncbi:MAG: cyanophycinase, partial [Bryobacteraceae bacterium]|nr:cyanophycinase [Bryobacteraceae bacterium]
YSSGAAGDTKTRTSAGLLLEGGGGDVETAWRWFLDKAGKGDIVVLRASGSDGYNKYLPTLAPVHSVASFVTKTREASSEKDLLSRIANAEGVFLAGGDQWNYVSRWKGTALGKAIDEAYARGVPVGGTSAGLAVLGEHAFSAERDTVTSAEALADPFHSKVTIESDFLHFSPMKGWITDSHFSKRDRMGRLLVWLARLQAAGKGNVRGIGIDEATAVMVDPTARAAVAGKASVYVVRLEAPVKRCVPGKPLDGAEYSVCRIPAGTSFDWNSTSNCAGASYKITVTDGVARSSLPHSSLYL